jgi:uncharacterized protein YutE (UPF0331/DUF86 family)
LDSNFEIALKEFITHSPDLFKNADLKKIFENRDRVITTVTEKVEIPEKVLRKVRHYYSIRNKLIHERATVDVTDADIDNYTRVIQQVLNILFDLTF